jgi:glycosyltransferase involved in cell wall biosynthesis
MRILHTAERQWHAPAWDRVSLWLWGSRKSPMCGRYRLGGRVGQRSKRVPGEWHPADEAGENGKAAQSPCKPPSVSVALTVLDGEATVAQAIESILGQTYTDLELIVVDDGSRDRTPEILASLSRIDPRVSVITNCVNIGIPCARNQALVASRGKYIVCCDADDWSAPHRVERLVSVLDNRPDIGVVLSRVQRVTRHGVPIEETNEYDHVEPYWNGDVFRIKLSGSCAIHGGEVAIRKSLLQIVGGYRPQFSLAEDYDLWLRLSTITDFLMLDDILYFRREYPAQTSRRLTALHTQLSFLARECHYIRLNGGDDFPYLNSESDRLHRKFGLTLADEHRICGRQFSYRFRELGASIAPACHCLATGDRNLSHGPAYSAVPSLPRSG